jgi:hypothetical protein
VVFFFQVTPTKTLYKPLLSSICITCTAHLIIFDFITRTVVGEAYRSTGMQSDEVIKMENITWSECDCRLCFCHDIVTVLQWRVRLCSCMAMQGETSVYRIFVTKFHGKVWIGKHWDWLINIGFGPLWSRCT